MAREYTAEELGIKPVQREYTAAELGLPDNKPTETREYTASELGLTPNVESSLLRETADIPLKVSAGAVSGVRMIADAFGANNPVSKNLRSVEDYIADLYSAESKADSKKVAEIMKEAEDKGVGANIRAAFEAFKVAPVDLLSNALGTAAPTILGGLAGGALKLGALGVRGAQVGLGAATGAGVTKGAIYDGVKEALADTKMPAEQVEARAQLAQSYGGKNLDQILIGTALGGLAGTIGIEGKFVPEAVKKIIGGTGAAGSKSVIKEAAKSTVKEAIPEVLQGGQEQLAQNLALQREGFDVPTMRGVVGQGTLEGLAGAGLGASIGAVSQIGENRAARALESDTTKNINTADLSDEEMQDTRDAYIKRIKEQIRGKASELNASQLAETEAVEQPTPIVAEETTTPVTSLDKATINSLGLRTGSNAYKSLDGLDLTKPEGIETFNQVLLANQDKIKEDKVNELLSLLPPIEPEVQNESAPIEAGGDRASVSTPDEQRLEVPAERAVETDRGAVDVAGADVGQPAAGAKPVDTPLESLVVGDTINIGEQTYRKTDNGFERVAPEYSSTVEEPQASEPEAIEATPYEAPPAVEEAVAPEVTEAMQPAEEPQAEDPTKQAKTLSSQLRSLDPTDPLIEDLLAYDVDEDTIAEARQMISQLVQERQAKGQTQPSELRELRDDLAETDGEISDSSGFSEEENILNEFDSQNFNTKGEAKRYTQKLIKQGSVDPKELKDIEYLFKDNNMGVADVVSKIRPTLVANTEKRKTQVPESKTILEPAVKQYAQDAIDGFLIGDNVRYGNLPGIVVGFNGDYVKFRPDSATNPKAYQRVQKSQLNLVSRPTTGVNASASKNDESKFGKEAGQLNADMSGLIQLLGANMYASNLADVSVKEMLQNSFDAVKGAIKVGLIKEGNITIDLDSDNRTIKFTDNARGMTTDIVKNAFFTVAGSDKSDLDPSERSGGLGLAKMGFMLGAEELKLNTVRDGVRTVVNTTATNIAKSNFDIVKTPAPKNAHGTTIEVKIPEFYTDPKTGDQKPIYFPYSADIEPLTKPLIGPTKVTVSFKGYGSTETKVLPSGVNFDTKEMPLLTKANFSWGSADIYFGVNRKKYPKHQVLSSGVYQFDESYELAKGERLPFDVIVNIKPNVDAKHPDYPFENSRERFKRRLNEDMQSLEGFLARVARGEEAKGLQESFKGIVSMPRVEAGEDVAEVSKKLKKVFDQRGAGETKFELPPMPKSIEIKDNIVSDDKGSVIVDRTKKEEKNKESTFEAENEAPGRDKFMLKMEQDPKLPIFHNNTNVDFIDLGKEFGDPQAFFAELGTLMVDMKEELSKSGMYSYDQLSPDNLFFGGISVDKGYGGVHIKIPYKAVLLNPFYDWGAKSLFGIRQNFLNTMMHEIAHQGDMSHGVGHNNQMIRVEQYLADVGMLDYFRDAIMDTLVRHESTFTAMREAYGRSTTTNTAKSLEDYAKGSASARGVNSGGGNKVRTVPSRGGQRRNGNIQANNRPSTQAVKQAVEKLQLKSGIKKPSNKTGKSLFKSVMDADLNHAIDNISSAVLSSDNGLNNQMRTALEKAGMPWNQIKKILEGLMTSQATHSQNVASMFLEMGKIGYNKVANMFEVTKNPSGSWGGMMQTIGTLAKKYGMSMDEMEMAAHTYFVANRSRGLINSNNRLKKKALALEVAGKRKEADKLLDKIVLINMTSAEIKAGLEIRKEITELGQVVEQWNVVRQEVISHLADTGLYSQEQAAELADTFDYVPFYREAQIEANQGPKENTRGLLDRARQKHIKGSYNPVNNVFDNMNRWITYSIARGINNSQAQYAVNAMQQYMVGSISPKPLPPTAKVNAGNLVAVWEKGVEKRYRVEDPMFIHYFTGARAAYAPLVNSWAVTGVNKVFRAEIILDPIFSAGQVMMDGITAMFTSGTKNFYMLPIRALKEFVLTIPNWSKTHKALRGFGAVGETDFASVSKRLAEEAKYEARDMNTAEKIAETLLKPLRWITTASDNAIRQAVYEQEMAESGDKATALRKAFEVINFRRAGYSSRINTVRQSVNFTGAYLQYINVTSKVLTGKGITPTQKKQTYIRLVNSLAGYGLLSFLLLMSVDDDDEYKETDQTTRDLRQFLPGITEKSGVWLPVRADPFMLVAKMIPEHIYNLSRKEGGEDWTKFKKAFKTYMESALLGPTPIPQLPKVLLETAMNKSLNTGRPIVGTGVEGRASEREFTASTSEFSKMLGQTGLVSPMMADYWINNLGASMGRVFIFLTNALMKDSDAPEQSTRDKLASFAPKFIKREFGTRAKNDLYELRDVVDEAYQTYKDVQKFGSEAEYNKIYEDKIAKVMQKPVVDVAIKQLAQIREEERMMLERPPGDMTKSDKEAYLKALKEKEQIILFDIQFKRNISGLDKGNPFRKQD